MRKPLGHLVAALLLSLAVFLNGNIVHAADAQKVCVIINQSSCQNNVGLPGANIQCGCVKRIIATNEQCSTTVHEIPIENIPSGTSCNFNYTFGGDTSTGQAVSFTTLTPRLQIPIPGFKGFTQILQRACETQADVGAVDDTEEGDIPPDDPEDADVTADMNSNLDTAPPCDNPYVNIPYISEYLSGIYGFLVGIVGILAGIMIVLGGFQWLLAAGEAPKITAAKKRIADALIGMILALGSYTLLYTVNPDLVTFKSLRIKLVNREELDVQSATDPANANYLKPGDPESMRLVSIPTGSGLMGKSQVTTAYNLQALLLVSRTLYDQYGINTRVASGARTVTKQLELIQKRGVWDPQKRNYVGKPGTVGTLSDSRWWLGPGQPNPAYANSITHKNSLDMYAGAPGSSWRGTAGVVIKNTAPPEFAGKTCSGCTININSGISRTCIATDPCQQAVMYEMAKAGFSVLMKAQACSRYFEPWHFNRTPDGSTQKGGLAGEGWRDAANRAKAATCK